MERGVSDGGRGGAGEANGREEWSGRVVVVRAGMKRGLVSGQKPSQGLGNL